MLWKSEVHHHVYRSPSLVHILSCMISVYVKNKQRAFEKVAFTVFIWRILVCANITFSSHHLIFYCASKNTLTKKYCVGKQGCDFVATSSTKECWALQLLQNKHFCGEKGRPYFIGREIKVDFVLVPCKSTYRRTSIKMSATALICDFLEDARQNKGRFTRGKPFPCCAHAVPLPCRAAKGLECVFLLWFTQCDRVWFTLAMPCPCHASTIPFFSRPQHSRAVERRPCCAVALRRTAWSEHGMGMACQGKCESDTAALCKSIWKDTF